MDKRTLGHLEKLFAAEIEGREIQLHPATAKKLEEAGLIQTIERSNRDRLGTFTWKVHVLTHAGRFAYCITCEDEPTPPPSNERGS